METPAFSIDEVYFENLKKWKEKNRETILKFRLRFWGRFEIGNAFRYPRYFPNQRTKPIST
ncbi:hypothetical protein CH380_08220 [Leptospira adleri]|uniref:Uncharacterized protein n=1 Tax=Leptospira adleri TaxID=2023186 RepID=A0A2M9YPW1_9LEPT|nr:hypothetical protein CH380_08220 [Leptospira adleri]PJZ61386.1 hypothetical protein CH376_13365 [Leptospira adleri]